MVIISHQNRFVFFKPIKVAGSSVEACLTKHCGPDDVLTGSDILSEREEHGYTDRNSTLSGRRLHMHTSPALLRSIDDTSWSNYFKFTITRNPWEVVVSYFWWCFYSPDSPYSDLSNSLISEEGSKETIAESMSPKKDDTPTALRRKFSKFVESVGSFNTGPRGDEGLNQIIDWLSRTNWEFYQADTDFTLRYETLQADYDKVCKVIRIPTDTLPHLKRDQRKSTLPYWDYYDDLSRIQVKVAFEHTIRKFEYQFR